MRKGEVMEKDRTDLAIVGISLIAYLILWIMLVSIGANISSVIRQQDRIEKKLIRIEKKLEEVK